MPINVYQDDEEHTKIAWLCDDSWSLPTQLDALENWLSEKKETLPDGKKIADIGFTIRSDASGGGAVFESESMKIFAEENLDIYFSEYRGVSDEEGND